MSAPPRRRLLASFTLRQAGSAILPWLMQVLRSLIKNRRYLPITPPFLRRQRFFDKKNKTVFAIEIRSWIDWVTTRQIFYAEDYGLATMWRYDEIKKHYEICVQSGKSPLVVDCGGNIGLASRYFSDTYPGTKIICVEPDAENLSLAKRNNFSEVTFFQSAVGSTECRGILVDPGMGCNSYRIAHAAEGTTEILSLNRLLAQNDPAKYPPFIVKIDIEGFEAELFSQNTEWIEKFPILIIELHDGMFLKTANSANFLKAISSLNRDFFYRGENIFSISNTLL
jgi:FkbM family methyltransferase